MSEENIPTKILANKEEIEISVPKFSVLVHKQGIKVDVPDFLEIDSIKTINAMRNMPQKVWKYISSSPVFNELFKIIFHEDDGIVLPENVEDLKDLDYGVIHICGLIYLTCDAMFTGQKKIFFRTPETYLHPKQQLRLVDLLNKISTFGS